MGRLAIVTTILILYIAGLLTSLWGPDVGRFLGVIAFLAIFVVLPWLNEARRKGDLFFKLGGLSGRWPVIRHGRGGLRVAMLFGIVLIVATMVVELIASGRAGVAEGTEPVFAHRDEYRLNNHGKVTLVSRERYLVVGSSFIIGWHVFGIILVLLALHLVLFGEWPREFGDSDGGSIKKGPPTDEL